MPGQILIKDRARSYRNGRTTHTLTHTHAPPPSPHTHSQHTEVTYHSSWHMSGTRGEAMLLWHTPAHTTVGNFKGEFTGLEKRRFTHLFCDTCCAGIRAGKFRNGHAPGGVKSRPTCQQPAGATLVCIVSDSTKKIQKNVIFIKKNVNGKNRIFLKFTWKKPIFSLSTRNLLPLITEFDWLYSCC